MAHRLRGLINVSNMVACACYKLPDKEVKADKAFFGEKEKCFIPTGTHSWEGLEQHFYKSNISLNERSGRFCLF